MTLATHAIIGAAVAQAFPHYPLLGFAAAFASHFVFDAIPHWDYKLRSYHKNPIDPLNGTMEWGKGFAVDLIKISFDCALGIAISLLLLPAATMQQSALALLGAFGGVLPDALQFAYWKLKIEPFRSLQKFHLWIHAKKRLDGKPVLGIILQTIIASAVIGIALIL